MRWSPVAFALLLLAGLPLHAASAGEEEPLKPVEPKEEPLVKLPDFALGDVVADDGAFPQGWGAAAGTMPASVPSVQALLDLAQGAGVDGRKVDARCRPMTGPGEAQAKSIGVAAWVSVDEKADAFTQALAKTAVERGWVLKQLGGPMRVALAWGGTVAIANAILEWEVETAVRKLCDLSVKTVNAAGQQSDRAQAKAAFDKGMRLLEDAGRTLPGAGLYHVWKGRIAESLARQAGQMGDRAAYEKQQAQAVLHYRKALEKGAPVPAPERMIVAAAFTAGQAILLAQDDSLIQEALYVLQRGVAAEKYATDHFQRFGNRYNLACTYARLGNKDKAFEHLEESLRYLKTAWEADKRNSFSGTSQLAYDRHYDHARNVDTDLAPLREDARWAALMKKYHPDAKPEADKPKEEPKKDEKAPEKKKPDGG